MNKVVNIILVSVVVFFSFKLIYEVREGRKAFDMETSSSGESLTEVTLKKPLSHFSVIEERNLFGISKQPEFRTVERDVIPGFRLKGTVVLESGGGYAVLENLNTKMQELYMVGDRIGELRFVSVGWERVVLKGCGGEKILAMVPPGKDELPPVKIADKVREKKVETVGDRRIIARSFVEESVANANQILTQVRIRPHFVSGVSEGYWVGNIQPGSVIERVGFQNGDIVKKVNGEAVDSPEKIFRAYQEIHETGVIAIDVERDGRIVTLTYEIRD